MFGPRRHHFAHHFVAELHHRLDQLAVVLFDEPFFGAGGDQRLDVLGGGGLFLGAVRVIGQIDQRLEEAEHASQGRTTSASTRSSGTSGTSHSAVGPAIEQLRQRDRPPRPW